MWIKHHATSAPGHTQKSVMSGKRALHGARHRFHGRWLRFSLPLFNAGFSVVRSPARALPVSRRHDVGSCTSHPPERIRRSSRRRSPRSMCRPTSCGPDVLLQSVPRDHHESTEVHLVPVMAVLSRNWRPLCCRSSSFRSGVEFDALRCGVALGRQDGIA